MERTPRKPDALPEANRESGISLVELMIAAVTSVALLSSVLMGVTQVSTHRQLALETNLAMVAAMNVLEEARTVDFANIPALHGTGFDVLDSLGNAGGLRVVPGDSDGLPGELSVAVEESSGGNTLYRVTATITWVGVMDPRSMFLETLIAERK